MQIPSRFQPRLTYHGFRYVEVSGPTSILNSLTLTSLTGCVAHSSVPFTGAFSCSNTNGNYVNLNKLMTNSFWGLRGNLQGVFTACASRGERQGYMYDEHIFSQTACYLADMGAFLTKTIRDIRANQAQNGRYPATRLLTIGRTS